MAMEEIAIRFVLGGFIVSVFAVIGEILTPKTFAGLFGAAPSVALATLGLTFATQGGSVVATECHTMMAGAVGFIAYSSACAAVVRHGGMPVWLGAGLCWAVWFLVSFSLWALVRGGVVGAV